MRLTKYTGKIISIWISFASFQLNRSHTSSLFHIAFYFFQIGKNTLWMDLELSVNSCQQDRQQIKEMIVEIDKRYKELYNYHYILQPKR